MGWVAAAIGIAQAGFGIVGAGKQKDVDQAQAELAYRDNLEKIRRRRFTQEQVKGTAKAFSEHTGVLHTFGSSAQGYLDTMAREFKLELDWMRRFAEEARKIGYARASAAHGANVLGSISSGVSTGLSIYGGLGGGGTTTTKGSPTGT
jgi:hypothetical protein